MIWLIYGFLLDDDKHPVQTVAHLMKLSFDEGHRQAICQLGGIHTVAALVEVRILSFFFLVPQTCKIVSYFTD